jgi:hypothetical protein
MRRSIPLAFAVAAAVGCGPTTAGTQDDAGVAGDAINNHLQQDANQQDDAYVPPPPYDAAPPTPTILYAHTGTKLYQVDPSVQPVAVSLIGTFDCVGGTNQDPTMTDIAVDKDGKLFAVSNTRAYPLSISGNTVHCDATWTLQGDAHYYGLTFAPAGVLRPTEMLVGANAAGELWAIDSDGATTKVGTFGNVPANDGHGHTYDSANVGQPWELSGDIVFLTNGGNWVGFATLRDCPNPPSLSGCNANDTLVELDLTNWQLGGTPKMVTKAVRGMVVKASGCADSTTNGYGHMYGTAALGTKVYGFSNSGNIVEISNVDGSACAIANISGDSFAGAGVTTLAPVIGPD